MTKSGAPPPMARVPIRIVVVVAAHRRPRPRRRCVSAVPRSSRRSRAATRSRAPPSIGGRARARPVARRAAGIGQQVERRRGARPGPSARCRRRCAPRRAGADRQPGPHEAPDRRRLRPAPPARPPPACRAHTPRRASCRRRRPPPSPAPARARKPRGATSVTPGRQPAPAAAIAGRIAAPDSARLVPDSAWDAVEAGRRCRAMATPAAAWRPAAEADHHGRAGPVAARPRPPSAGDRRATSTAYAGPSRQAAASTSEPADTARAEAAVDGEIGRRAARCPTSWIDATRTPARRAARSQGRAAVARRIVDRPADAARGAITASGSGPARASRPAAALSHGRRRCLESRHAASTPTAPARWRARTRCPKPMRGLAATRKTTSGGGPAARARRRARPTPWFPARPARLTPPVRAGR